MLGVLIGGDGGMTSKSITCEDGCLFVDRIRLNQLHTTNDIALLSTNTYDSLLNGSCFRFELPPPLSLYIYPEPVFVLKYTNGEYSDLSCSELAKICNNYVKHMKECADDVAVYDVPLVVESEEEDDVEEEDVQSSEDENDDEDWDDEDDPKKICTN